MSSLNKRFRDEEEEVDLDDNDMFANPSLVKKSKLADGSAMDPLAIPAFTGNATMFEDDDDVENVDSDQEDLSVTSGPKKPQTKTSIIQDQREMIYKTRLKAQGIVLSDDEADDVDMFDEDKADDSDADNADGEARKYASALEAKYKEGERGSLVLSNSASKGVAVDEDWEARRRAMFATYDSDTRHMEKLEMNEKVDDSGAFVMETEKKRRKANANGDDDDESDDEWTHEHSKGDAAEGEEVSVSDDLQSKTDRVLANLAQGAEKVDPYFLLKNLARFLKEDETIAGMLRRMRPAKEAAVVKKKNVRKSEQQTPTSSQQDELTRKRAQGEFSIVSECVNSLIALGEYDMMNKTKPDVELAIEKIEIAKGIKTVPSKWWIKWDGQTDEHGPNESQQMNDWKSQGFFNSCKAQVRLDGQDTWSDATTTQYQ